VTQAWNPKDQDILGSEQSFIVKLTDRPDFIRGIVSDDAHDVESPPLQIVDYLQQPGGDHSRRLARDLKKPQEANSFEDPETYANPCAIDNCQSIYHQ
jgi:hypothetical protein